MAMLFIIVVIGISLGVAGEVWSTSAKRHREMELLFRGEQFSAAIGSYYRQSPGVKRYPKELADLLEDNRFPGVKRHLRKIYIDPMTGKADWQLITEKDGSIRGVRSSSLEEPMKKDEFPLKLADFKDAESYGKWEFVYNPHK